MMALSFHRVFPFQQELLLGLGRIFLHASGLGTNLLNSSAGELILRFFRSGEGFIAKKHVVIRIGRMLRKLR